ncbi:AbrB/MazE/SpoVT family DNA-binding domain-containing protein [Candidatus Sumerlaeota bacterium]|nr:AbrB/MazE/SpoVT family DNA-binding domain-containing protein [Candidatus Sumerlaeota bacterium]
METAKIFLNGRSQAVRLPREFRFNQKEVYVKKIDGIVMLIPKGNPWKIFVSSLDKFSGDFCSFERDQ